MNTKDIVKYWLRSADEDVLTAESLFNTKRYLPCLFFCHLFAEKIIKALIVKKTGKSAPYGHKLSRLAKQTDIEFAEDQLVLLDDLTAFNIKTRYEDYKFQMYKKAKSEYTKKYLGKSKELYIWLKEKV